MATGSRGIFSTIQGCWSLQPSSLRPARTPAALPLWRAISRVWSSLPSEPPTPYAPDRTCPRVRRRGRGQASAQGHPLLPSRSAPAGPAAALAAAIAQLSPAAGAAAIFVGPARPPATGFTVSQGACAPTLRIHPLASSALA